MVSFTSPWFPWHNPEGKKCPCAISSIRFQVLRPIMYSSENFWVGSQELRWGVLHTSEICWWLTANHPNDPLNPLPDEESINGFFSAAENASLNFFHCGTIRELPPHHHHTRFLSWPKTGELFVLAKNSVDVVARVVGLDEQLGGCRRRSRRQLYQRQQLVRVLWPD